MKGFLRSALIFLFIQGVLSFVALMTYIAYSLTQVIREPVVQSPADLGLEYEDLMFHSRVEQLRLQGWWLPGGEEDRCIIMIHGGERHRANPHIGMLRVARDLVDHGYSVFLFDMRGLGESDGKPSSVGYYERRDLLGAIDYVLDRGLNPQRIGLLGYSMGGAIAILVAADNGLDLPVVSDSPFADLPKLVEREASKRIHLPRAFNVRWMSMSRLIYGTDLRALRTVELIHKLSPVKVLLIHGAEDEIVPVADAQALHAASNNVEDSLWIVPDASHSRGYKAMPEEYIFRVVSFFDSAIAA